MLDQIALLTAKWRERLLSDAEFTAAYFLCWQIHKHGKRFAARVSRDLAKPNSQSLSDALYSQPQVQRSEYLVQYMEWYQYRGVIPAVNFALAKWLRGVWSIRLCEFIPAPDQVLAMQVEGVRPVTIITAYPRMLHPVLTKADAFEFLLHDLEHAFQFFHNDCLHREQRALFALLQRILDQGLFAPYTSDADYAHKLTYLLSDMNTHAAHALQYLRGMFVDYYLRRDGKAWNEALSSQAISELRTWVDHMAQVADFAAAERQSLHAFFEGRYNDALLRQLVIQLTIPVRVNNGQRESHPRALPEPDVNLSIHPAPIAQPVTQRANARIGPVAGCAARSTNPKRALCTC